MTPSQIIGRLCLGLLLAALSCGAAEAQVREFRLSHQWTADVDARDKAAHIFADEVSKQLPDVKIQIRAALGYGVGAIQQYDALLAGNFELCIYPLFYASKKVPELSIALMPGVPDNAKLARLLRGSEFEGQVQQLAEANGVHILAWFWFGGGLVSRVSPITGPDSVKGLRGRGGDPIFDQMLKAAGATPVEMASTDIAASLKDGKLDFAVTSYDSLVSLGVYKQSKFATMGGYGLWTSLQPLMISQKAWDRLTDSEQAVFEHAAEVAEQWFASVQADAEETTVKQFAEAGIQIRQFTFDEYSAWLGIAKETSWRSYMASSPTAARLLTSMLKSFIATGKQ